MRSASSAAQSSVGRGAGAAEDQPAGVEDAAQAVAHQPLGRPGRLQPEHRPVEPGGGEQREGDAGRAGHLVRPGARERHLGGEDERVGGGGVAGLEHRAG